MSTGMKNIYDNASEHFGLGSFPSALPIEQAYVHIGFFLGWVVENEKYSEFFEDEGFMNIFRFKNRQISCTILAELWNGKLGQEMFNEEGNLFTFYYYGGGIFKSDLVKTLGQGKPTPYHIEDSWENYEKMSAVISLRYRDWKNLVSL